MKSWISFLLPDDEYKEKRILYFLTEGSIILLLSLIVTVSMNRYVTSFQTNLEVALILSILTFSLYVFIRYVLSGMEYTDITTEQAFKNELRVIFIKTSGFVFIYLLLYMVFVAVPTSRNEWFEILGLLLGVSLLWFFSSYISLKRSYKKNKELL